MCTYVIFVLPLLSHESRKFVKENPDREKKLYYMYHRMSDDEDSLKRFLTVATSIMVPLEV